MNKKNKSNATHTKGLLPKKEHKSCQILSFLLITIFTQQVPAGRQNVVNVLNFLLSSLTCSQIWLIPLVDDCQCGYITKLKNK
jgi:hypothetical protein